MVCTHYILARQCQSAHFWLFNHLNRWGGQFGLHGDELPRRLSVLSVASGDVILSDHCFRPSTLFTHISRVCQVPMVTDIPDWLHLTIRFWWLIAVVSHCFSLCVTRTHSYFLLLCWSGVLPLNHTMCLCPDLATGNPGKVRSSPFLGSFSQTKFCHLCSEQHFVLFKCFPWLCIQCFLEISHKCLGPVYTPA